MQNFPIQTFNGHCYALKTGLKYMTFYVPITLAINVERFIIKATRASKLFRKLTIGWRIHNNSCLRMDDPMELDT